MEATVFLEAVEARIRGLVAKLDDNAKGLAQLRAEMAQARTAWNRQRISELLPEYLKAVAAFSAVNRKLCALGEALGDKTAIDAAQDAAAFSPITGQFILEDAVASGHEKGWAYGQWDPDWESDPKAKAIYEANRGPAETLARVDQLLSNIRNRKESPAASRGRSGENPQGQVTAAEPMLSLR